MHSLTTRLNAIASYAVLVLFIALGFNVASHFVLTAPPVVSVSFVETQQAYVADSNIYHNFIT
jgi:hypothetical protein